MSSIDFLTKTVIWTDNDYIGLNDAWVENMISHGYTLIDQRKGHQRPTVIRLGDKPHKGVKKILNWLNLKI